LSQHFKGLPDLRSTFELRGASDFRFEAWVMLLATWWAWSIWLRARNTWGHPEHARRDGERRPGGLGAETGPVRGDPDRIDFAERDHHGGCGLVGVAEQFAPLAWTCWPSAVRMAVSGR
jgi:hypothetical protein